MARTGQKAISFLANPVVLVCKTRYTIIMKNRLMGIVILVVLSLISGGIVDHVYANIHQGCSCCKNQCQSKEKCHENTKECFCRYSAPLQVYLFKSDMLPNLACLGFFVSRLHFNYVYLSAKDIFHPPKPGLS